MKPSGNTILITGGASGIGLELARRLVTSGNTVVVCGRDPYKLESASRRVPSLLTIQADIANRESRAALIAHAQERLSGLNVLVNNAGIVNVSNLADTDFISKLQSEIDTNFVGPVSLIHGLLPLLARQSEATIVNVSTGYVFLTSARTPHYSATKTALHSMTQSLRYQLKSSNIRVLEIMPPPVDTDMAAHYHGAKSPVGPIADKFLNAMLSEKEEVVIGLSNVPRIVGRMMPRLAFAVLNDGESRAAERASQ